MNDEDEIRAAMNSWNEAVAEGNITELSKILLKDDKTMLLSRGIQYVGYDLLIEQFKEWFKTMRIHLTSKGMIINHLGSVAWVADDQYGKIVDLQGNILSETPILKWTSVLVRRNGKWVFTQIHHSTPQP